MYRVIWCAVAALLVAIAVIAGCSLLLALNPNDAVAYYNRGSAYFDKGDYNQGDLQL